MALRQTAEKKEQIFELIAQGATLREISEEVNISENTLKKFCYKNNLKFAKNIRKSNRKTFIGQEFGLWKVTKALGYKDKEGNYSRSQVGTDTSYYVLCQCLGCGKERSISTSNLIGNRTKACNSCAAKLRHQRAREER